jgi:hypothetical protein
MLCILACASLLVLAPYLFARDSATCLISRIAEGEERREAHLSHLCSPSAKHRLRRSTAFGEAPPSAKHRLRRSTAFGEEMRCKKTNEFKLLINNLDYI